MTTVIEQAGWGSPLLAKKAHYFTTSGRLLCGKWAYTGERESCQSMGSTPGEEDCKECWRKARAFREGRE